MKKSYKIRIHSARMETKYGVDFATVVDNAAKPEYTEKEIIAKLMDMLSYEEATDDNSEYPGYYEYDVGAYFDYDGFIEVDIPESIVNDIVKSEMDMQNTTTFTAFVYEDDGIIAADLSTYASKEEAIEFAKSRSWGEVVNDNTGEVVWRK